MGKLTIFKPWVDNIKIGQITSGLCVINPNINTQDCVRIYEFQLIMRRLRVLMLEFHIRHVQS